MVAIVLAGVAMPADGRERGGRDPAPAFDSFVLANGLKVVVHEDRKAPVVSVVVLYRVGSKDEKPGQFGFAHLFEHLMLGGSEHHDQDYFRTMREMGATDINGTTTADRTVYYETVPRGALDRALFLESDRMGHLLGALTQARLDNQIAVVLNEKRQAEDRPYGGAWAHIHADLYPVDHPYHHSTIGTDADLRGMTLDKARDWFRDWYGPSNAVLFLSGDIDVAEARALAGRHFADIAPGRPVGRLLAMAPPPAAPIRRTMQARVPAARLYRQYVMPPAGSATGAYLDLSIQMLANGTASRLRRRLVDDLGIATAVSVTFNENQLAGEFGVAVDAKSPEAVPRIEAALDAELARFAAEGPSPDELARAKSVRSAFLSRMQDTAFGWNMILSRGESLADDPGHLVDTNARTMAAATPEDVRLATQRVLAEPGHTLIVTPFAAHVAGPPGYDRSLGLPPVTATAAATFPPLAEAQLSNGLRVLLARRQGTPGIEMMMQFDAGAASGDPTRQAGPFAMALTTRETRAHDERALAETLEAMGASLRGQAGPDVARISLSVPGERLAGGVDLLAEVLRRPRFSDAAFASERSRRLAGLRREAGNTGSLAQRALRAALYGPDHPYGANAKASQDIAAVEALNLATVRAWHSRWLRPDTATLFVVGDTQLAELMPLLEARLGGWRADGAAPPRARVPAGPPRAGPRLIVIDRPNARQSLLVAGRLIPPAGSPDDTAIEAANEVFGGNFTARINTDLRQTKGWSYGIGSGSNDAMGPRLWQIAGSVQADRTGDSIAALQAQMRAIAGDDPPRADELAGVVGTVERQLPARLESNRQVLASIADSAAYGRPYDSQAGRPARYRALTPDAVAHQARTLFDPSAMTWIVVGDWSKISGQFATLGLGAPDLRPAAQ